mmetsp:Transcript_46577/g.76984  ORF Transcript_46577/g.76984 Transcript_46577/m.76984 type:complete len:523 (-) Transcript_46577:80-1648(-)|eukprot:CAMPEP_0119339702 /NCGR_PEP_ID=MMETSP1333-20130426/98836_1 /TAXON_ID=418940 /ORGANISM="Scyphosphaera apsteinii, Strain RCC1455" /LENGTH=522 /DNA_ID=CAMNT_0007351283 /DNA_START=365 /DNA_END=1933 /DNA_ORIENTATION=-
MQAAEVPGSKNKAQRLHEQEIQQLTQHSEQQLRQVGHLQQQQRYNAERNLIADVGVPRCGRLTRPRRTGSPAALLGLLLLIGASVTFMTVSAVRDTRPALASVYAVAVSSQQMPADTNVTSQPEVLESRAPSSKHPGSLNVSKLKWQACRVSEAIACTRKSAECPAGSTMMGQTVPSSKCRCICQQQFCHPDHKFDQGVWNAAKVARFARNLNFPVPAPESSQSFAALMALASAHNGSVLRYVYPTMESLSTDAAQNWVPHTKQCKITENCYCFHVDGDMRKMVNPNPTGCAGESTLFKGCDETRNCLCISADKPGNPCLFSDMRPAKVLAVIAAARAAGVRNIIEEGRFGGLSAYMYALHGFDVFSIEFLPLDAVTLGLQRFAPNVRLLDGDGRKLLPSVVNELRPQETMVIFDAEKRFSAWQTFDKIRNRVALAVFDDTILAEGAKFIDFLDEKGEVWWETRMPGFEPFLCAEKEALTLLQPLRDRAWRTKKKILGSLAGLEMLHFAIVKGGAWAGKQKY